MVYAMYMSLPVTLYVWFLRRRVIEVALARQNQLLDFRSLLLAIKIM